MKLIELVKPNPFPDVDVLLGKGYFPRELPPPFQTTSWADFVSFNRDELPPGSDPKFIKFKANVCTHSVPRLRGARRTLGIPNPISQLILSEVLVDGANELMKHIHDGPRPYLSASRPMHWRTKTRALEPRYKIGERTKLRLLTRRAARCVLHTDISQFYGSIYTHSIPWALHTKSTSKAHKHDAALLGNRIDRAVQNGQDAQTIGIPIGPDTSLLIAEIVLRAADDQLRETLGNVRGFRYIDDYEFAFQSRADAERALARVEGVLHRFELKMNPRKTYIEDVPVALEEPWVDRIREISSGGSQMDVRTVRRLASVAFELAHAYPNDSVLKFALATVASKPPVNDQAAQYMQSFAFNAIAASPIAVPVAMGILATIQANDFAINSSTVREILSAHLVS